MHGLNLSQKNRVFLRSQLSLPPKQEGVEHPNLIPKQSNPQTIQRLLSLLVFSTFHQSMGKLTSKETEEAIGFSFWSIQKYMCCQFPLPQTPQRVLLSVLCIDSCQNQTSQFPFPLFTYVSLCVCLKMELIAASVVSQEILKEPVGRLDKVGNSGSI